jgi:carbonic anhydrase
MREWSYKGGTGPEFWAQLCKEYKTCNGKHQSPINLADAIVKHHLPKIQFWDKKAIVRKENTPNFPTYFLENDLELMIGSKQYQLIQFHLHSPSEHTTDNIRHKLEIHFVHHSEDENFMVIGLFVNLGKSNKILRDLFLMDKYIELDIRALIPEDTSYYIYRGSLTTPPCTEGIEWIVLKNSIELNPLTYLKWQRVLQSNARPIQEINERKIFFKQMD